MKTTANGVRKEIIIGVHGGQGRNTFRPLRMLKQHYSSKSWWRLKLFSLINYATPITVISVPLSFRGLRDLRKIKQEYLYGSGL